MISKRQFLTGAAAGAVMALIGPVAMAEQLVPLGPPVSPIAPAE